MGKLHKPFVQVYVCVFGVGLFTESICLFACRQLQGLPLEEFSLAP